MASETPLYDPTPRKLADIRRHGEVPRSRELNGVLVILVGPLALWFTFDELAGMLKENFALVFDAIQSGSSSPLTVLQTCLFRGAFGLAPFIVLVSAVGVAAGFLQVGPLFSLRAVFVRTTAFDPLSRLASMFTGWRVLELFVALLKLSVVGCIVWITLQDGLRGVFDSMQSDLRSSMTNIGKLAVVLWFRVVAALLIFAVGDLFYQRHRFRQSQKMTHDELVREQRETYGDPLVRQRRGRIYRERIAHETLEETARATIVVHGETRVAVALRYQPEGDDGRAPEIVAKGERVLAQRILHTATFYVVPTVSDFRLAMDLYQLEVGREIPRDLYTEVAAALKSVGTARRTDRGRTVG